VGGAGGVSCGRGGGVGYWFSASIGVWRRQRGVGIVAPSGARVP
jgi:hypothetical protein